MVQIIVMVGIQGSGKSTKARELSEDINAVILSSDEIRKYNPSWDNNKVFEYLYKEMNNYVKDGKNIIIDATNTTLQSRKAIFNNLKFRADVQIYAWVMNTSYAECVSRVMARNKKENTHKVPIEVIKRYRDSFQIPLVEEGFDDVVMNTYNSFNSDQYLSLIHDMIGFDQQNSHHTLDLYNHAYKAGVDFDDIEIGLFHDVGKLFCQTFDDNGEAHYYNHANIGAYYLITHTEAVRFSNFENIVAITNYHMLPYNWKEEKTHNKYKKIFGEHLYNKLIKFHEADEGAH